MDLEFVIEEDVALEAEASGASFGVLETGIYPVTINFAALDKTKGGNNTVSLDIVTDTGHETTIWSAFGTIDKTWASGKENFGYKDWQAFMGACGAKGLTPVKHDLKKEDGTLIKTLSVIKELHGAKCMLAIQKELDIYNGEQRERNLIHSSYNAKGQTLSEAKENAPAEKIEKVRSRLEDKKTKAFTGANTPSVSFEEEESSDSLL